MFLCLWIGAGGDKAFVENGGFDGAYSYFASDGFTGGSNSRNWKNIADVLRGSGKRFVPAVGPGYIDTLVRPWNGQNIKDREGGAYYDRMWQRAIDINPWAVSITSYNEWGEGTQIEAAVPYTSPKGRSYLDYGPAQPDFYLRKTKQW